MSDTVLIALITFISGLSGALIGAISTWKLSKQTSDSETHKQLRSERLVAYSEYLSAYFKYSVAWGPAASLYHSGDSTARLDTLHELGTTFSKALIVASPKTQIALRTFNEKCLEGNGKNDESGSTSDYGNLISCIQEDLQIHHPTEKLSALESSSSISP